MELVPQLLQSPGHRCIDISGAYRVPWEDRQFRQIYGHPHTDLGQQSVYGLPELQEDATLRDARLIATAGTVSTAVLLAIAPLCIHEAISPADPVRIEARCGSSVFSLSDRSSRKMERESEDRHEPEIRHGLRNLTGHELSLVGLHIERTSRQRGVEARINFGGARMSRWDEVQRLYKDFYAPEGLVRVATDEMVDDQHLVNTHFCELSQGRGAVELTVVARLDNLGKGGPGQLVQNLNIALGKDDPLHGLL
jgi:N-acetyl-gamma-glutamyl-phosphate reductase